MHRSLLRRTLENNLDIIAKKKNYMDYLANRPGVEIIGTHGLFSNEGEPVVLSRVQKGRGGKSSRCDLDECHQPAEGGCRAVRAMTVAAQWQALLR